ncbi:MAG: iron ABC transporter permease [Pseudomonadota bacterium]
MTSHDKSLDHKTTHSRLRTRKVGAPHICVLLLVLFIISLWALTIGSSSIGLAEVFGALTDYDGSREHIIALNVRLPRIIAGVLVGASLAVSGALMQAVTNNPLASPGLLGVNAGAAFAIVLSLVLFDLSSMQTLVWFAFAGAGISAVVVYWVGSIGFGGATPLKLAIAGAITSAFLAALTTTILIFDKTTLDNIRLWTVGSLANRTLPTIGTVLPYLLIGLAAAIAFSRQVTTLGLGPDVARTVGQNLLIWRSIVCLIVVLLAGSAVALAGPIGFVGLVVPHIARFFCGSDYGRIVLVSALTGALLVVLGDNVLRFAFPSKDIPVGVTMAILGAPFFIFLARNRLRGAN